MLRFLKIKRLAVIDSVEVEFDPGLNVLTGETGAGKSILVEAVGLLLGGRASGDLVRSGEETAIIEAIFDADGDELLVRREVTAQGRSRVFVNGDLSTVAALKERTSRLIELHGQHEHQTLLDPATHLAVLDGFGGLDDLVAPVREAFLVLAGAGQELARARLAASEDAARRELAAYQLGELDAVSPTHGEDDELAATRRILANADRIAQLCEDSYAALYERDDAVLAALGGVWRRVGELAALDARFLPSLDVRDGIKAQLEDLAMLLRRCADGIDASPVRLQQVEDRLARLERLKRKYGPTLADVLARRDSLRQDVDALDQGEGRLADIERRRVEARRRFVDSAARLSAARQDLGPTFARAIETLLADLAMPQTRFEVRFGAPMGEDGWTAAGVDQAEFFMSPNPGEEPRALARIVSGGELSRIMLAIKTLAAGSQDRSQDRSLDRSLDGLRPASTRAPVGGARGLIFDEVDAGIGGRVADVVGRRLRVLGSAFQVLCITHLPQIAAYADSHFQIEKTVEGGRTRTSVIRLDQRGRVEELSRMLGGAGVTDAIRSSAREMLADRQAGGKAKGESKSKGESESPPTKPVPGRSSKVK